jgi:hypothetical protein
VEIAKALCRTVAMDRSKVEAADAQSTEPLPVIGRRHGSEAVAFSKRATSKRGHTETQAESSNVGSPHWRASREIPGQIDTPAAESPGKIIPWNACFFWLSYVFMDCKDRIIPLSHFGIN